MSDENTASRIDQTVRTINKLFGDGAVMKLGEAVSMRVDVISTGSMAIDVALGVGGIPRGRICEIYGPESSGKTTFCLSVVASAQKMGGVAAFVDVEHALDPTYAKVVGVDLGSLLIAQPESGEMALQIVEQLIQSGNVDVVILDSVAALVTKGELEGQLGDATVGQQARLMGQAMRRLTAAISRTRCVCIFTNQIRDKIGVSYGNPETTPGGRALKFFSSLRLDIRRVSTIKDSDGKVIGSRTRIKVVKNKVAPPFRECEFDILFGEGISNLGSLVDLGIECGILTQRGAWIYLADASLGQGRVAAKAFLGMNPDMATLLRDGIMEHVNAFRKL
ncbi:MAG: recombinase RecA [Puniceicoccales bacterium]|jgi:recombination protein RecA|nr:recombinase RecA [Puniceicoccales bacterium]